MKPRLRAVEVGRIVVSVLGEKEGLEILASCLGSPIRRNSVFEGLRVSKLAAIQCEISARRVSRQEIV